MVPKIKPAPRRRYRSALRSAQSARTRQAVLDAARTLFLSAGWSGTTIVQIAEAASLSKETIYAVFGNKRAILQQIIANAVRGGTPNVPLLEQSKTQRIASLTDQIRQIELFAFDIAKILDRVAPLVAAVRAAAGAEPELAELYRTLHDGRRRNLRFFVDALSRNGGLRSGIDAGTATAIVWRLTSPELFLLMRQVEGLSLSRYSAWLRGILIRLLLRHADANS